jgi:hypothetical protein
MPPTRASQGLKPTKNVFSTFDEQEKGSQQNNYASSNL